MPLPDTEQRNQEAVILARSVENLFRKLVRFLVGRVSLVRLQELLRSIFIEETENKLRKENPSGNVTLTQLALLSGLDTRTLTKIRNHPNYRKPFHQEADFLQQFVVGASLLNDWNSKSPYVDESTGKPRTLKISGKQPSFESLFEESTKSRGVTYKSLLKRLARNGAVVVNRDTDEVKLVANSYLPVNSKDKLGAIEIGFSALANLTGTITNNISALENGGEKMFQRGTWTYKLREAGKKDMRDELSLLLEETDAAARKIIEKHEDSAASPDSVTAGISLFYFEERD
jgi:hypothetical protein